MSKLLLSIFAMCFVLETTANAAPRIAFSGTPEIRFTDLVIERSENPLTTDERSKFKVVITEDRGRYFWTTRDNIEVSLSLSGAYTTYTAMNGSGYLRIEDPTAHQLMESKAPAYRFDYKEHLQQGLTSVTYYGRRDR